jgi:Na+-translocating ferredoxin:NAD+ oxidoreductase subunit G
MKKTLLVGSKLALICGVAAVVLGFVNAVTGPKIIQNKKEALRRAIQSVAGDREVGEQTAAADNPGIEYYYEIEGAGGGYIVKLVGTGYGGEMHLLAGYRPDGEIFSVVLMENQETPGLGKKAEAEGYMDKYIGTGGNGPVPVLKEQLSRDDADAVTGATITFVGIGQALLNGSEFVKSLGEEE